MPKVTGVTRLVVRRQPAGTDLHRAERVDSNRCCLCVHLSNSDSFITGLGSSGYKMDSNFITLFRAFHHWSPASGPHLSWASGGSAKFGIFENRDWTCFDLFTLLLQTKYTSYMCSKPAHSQTQPEIQLPPRDLKQTVITMLRLHVWVSLPPMQSTNGQLIPWSVSRILVTLWLYYQQEVTLPHRTTRFGSGEV